MSLLSVPVWQHGHEPCLFVSDGKYLSDPRGVRVEDLGAPRARSQFLAARLSAGERIVIAQHSMLTRDVRSVLERFSEPFAVLVGWTVYERPFERLDTHVWKPVLPDGRVLAIAAMLSGGWTGDMGLCVDVLLRGGALFFAPRVESGASIACAVYTASKDA